MPEKIRVNISTLSQDLTELRRLAGEAKINFSSLKECIGALHTTWEGSAHDALSTQFEGDAKIMDEVLSALDSFLNSVKFAHDEYSACENNVSSEIDSIQV